MGKFSKIKSFIFYDTFGALTTANLIICLISGVLLAIPYNIADPYGSISYMMIADWGGTLYRNLHYWSAQLFLIFTILHIWDHFKKSTEKSIKPGIWLRLTISILVTFFVMLSGFILKGDQDSMQAFRILNSLIAAIPLAGEILARSLLGNEDDLQLLYVHHIATGTVFLIIVLFEHIRNVWPKMKTFVITTLILLLVSFVFMAPLHDNINPVVKGPWYFVGLQEILHWVGQPGYTLLLVLFLLLIVYLIPRITGQGARWAKQILLYIFYMYLILTVIGYLFRGENWNWITPWSSNAAYQIYFPFQPEPLLLNSDKLIEKDWSVTNVRGRGEACLLCHDGVAGFSPAHEPEAIGCTSCHLGNPFTLSKQAAHRNMILIPGNLDRAVYTCGTADCHPEITQRIQSGMMTTLSGIVSVDRFVFDEYHSPDMLANITDLKQTPADNHLRDLCASCHLGNPKIELGPIDQLSRGGGCNACHLNYSEIAENEVQTYLADSKRESSLPNSHPSLSIEVKDEHCFGCHSRSGRISTSYAGWHETLFRKGEIELDDSLYLLEDDRIFEFIGDDVHHKAGMNCIDCHTSYELMGDGKLHLHKEEQVKVECADCHYTGSGFTISKDALDSETSKILGIRQFEIVAERFIQAKGSDVPLLNTFLDFNDDPYLILKNSGKILKMNAPDLECTAGAGHDNLSCRACHTAWAPRCIGCHNTYDKNEKGYDLLDNAFVDGAWIEHVGKYLALAPTLGMEFFEDSSGSQSNSVVPVTPGMILTIDKSEYTGQQETMIFKRLFSPIVAHTTDSIGRSCKSCHNDPLAIGYGEGNLEYVMADNIGTWIFKPRYSLNQNDGLPEDAWMGFLKEATEPFSTRTNIRPFSLEEQQRILTVGSCLICHEDKSEVMQRALMDFKAVSQEIKGQCVIPRWE